MQGEKRAVAGPTQRHPRSRSHRAVSTVRFRCGWHGRPTLIFIRMIPPRRRSSRAYKRAYGCLLADEPTRARSALGISLTVAFGGPGPTITFLTTHPDDTVIVGSSEGCLYHVDVTGRLEEWRVLGDRPHAGRTPTRRALGIAACGHMLLFVNENRAVHVASLINEPWRMTMLGGGRRGVEPERLAGDREHRPRPLVYGVRDATHARGDAGHPTRVCRSYPQRLSHAMTPGQNPSAMRGTTTAASHRHVREHDRRSEPTVPMASVEVGTSVSHGEKQYGPANRPQPFRLQWTRPF